MLICTCKRYGFYKCNNILSCPKRVNLKQIKQINHITKYYGQITPVVRLEKGWKIPKG